MAVDGKSNFDGFLRRQRNMTVSYRRQAVFVSLAPQVSGLMQNTYLVQKRRLKPLFLFFEPKLKRGFSPPRPQELLACKTPTLILSFYSVTCTSSSYTEKKENEKRDIYKATSTTMFALSCCAAADCLALLATVAYAFAFAASKSRTSITMFLFSRIIMRST